MADPLYLTIRDDILTRLRAMSQANGYELDYGEVVFGVRMHGHADADYDRPDVGVRWLGELLQDPISGGERATSTTGRYPQFEVSVPVRDDRVGDHEARAWKIQQDIEKAMIESNSVRQRGLNRCTTFPGQPEWLDVDEAGESEGGLLLVVYVVRFDHVTGDLSTEA